MKDDWVLVHECSDEYRIELVRQMLDNEGIHSVIINKKDSTYKSFGDLELYVGRDDVVRAKALINNMVD